jgi:transketolase
MSTASLITKTVSTKALAKRMRIHILNMIHRTHSSHIGSCYSMVDMLAVLYGVILNIDPKYPKDPLRDRFILSKGHAGAALYAILAEHGFFEVSDLDHYNQDGTSFSGHVMHEVPGVEVSTGSLGHGLSIGCGMAYAAKIDKLPYKVYVLLSDGECDEGSNWEAILFAPHHRLDNLIVIVDYNKIQSFGSVKEVLDLEPFVDKWKAFGWHTVEVDGHDHEQMISTFKNISTNQSGRPSVCIAHTVKGKGVSFMENKLLWHYKSPDDLEYQNALHELNEHR